MGKPKKGGYAPPQPSTRFVSVKNGEIENKTIAWGDWVVWQNQDNVAYTLVVLSINGQPAASPAPVWATLSAVGTLGANSAPRNFGYPGAPPKDPYVYQYGMQDPPNAKATLTVQISV